MSAEPKDFTVTLLESKKHDRAAFSCGEPSLDSYIKRQASQDMKRGAAAAYVLTVGDDNRVTGYYTLSANRVLLKGVTEGDQKKLARCPETPACLIGRLAVDETYKKRGLGGFLLQHALKRALEQSQGLGIALVIVDALNENAQRFYEKYGFELLASNDERRLYLPVKTIANSL